MDCSNNYHYHFEFFSIIINKKCKDIFNFVCSLTIDRTIIYEDKITLYYIIKVVFAFSNRVTFLTFDWLHQII